MEERALSGLCAQLKALVQEQMRVPRSRLESPEVPQHGREATLGQELCFGYSERKHHFTNGARAASTSWKSVRVQPLLPLNQK